MTSLVPRRSRQLGPALARRQDPLAEIEQLQDRMSNLIQNFFADPFPALTAAAAPVWVPPVNIEDTEDSYILEMDLPGVRAEDINLELRDSNELRVSGQYSERERTGRLRRQTRRTGQFEYDVVMPGEVDPEQIDATLQDGVLTVHLAKPSGQPRRIEVKGMGTAGQAEQAAGEGEQAQAEQAAGEGEQAQSSGSGEGEDRAAG
jgi:HSP20 family protein